MEGKDLTTIKNIKDDCVLTFLAIVKARSRVRVWNRNKSTGKIMTGVLMDTTGSIDFVCWTEGVMKFEGILKENMTYKFSKAKSVFAKENYSKTKHCCQIILGKNSEITNSCYTNCRVGFKRKPAESNCGWESYFHTTRRALRVNRGIYCQGQNSRQFRNNSVIINGQ